MHTRLSWVLGVLSVACIAGAALIVAFALGYYSVPSILVSGLVGLVLGTPLGVYLSKRIKREDPDWPPSRA
ncbi:hypothetical protein [Oceanicola sp. 22II-s10i]|uniref:hypothetical protein n=1 Tax=Oceanicola sp. 22II-s10i TaxID=1317116 RepID=UPI000B527D0B|nr:hypothetical protein [Oceanicola sp. 22II-s10i]